MSEWTVPNMTCGRCATAVTRAVMALDPDAEVNIDLAARRVVVDAAVDDAQIARALAERGYEPQPVG